MATVTELPGQTEILRENLQRDVEVTARLEGLDLGTGVAAVQKAVSDLKLPPSIRVEYGGTYKEQQKSFHDLVVVLLLALVLIFLVLLFEFRSFSAPDRDSFFRGSFHLGRLLRSADHAHHLQRFLVHGADHGGRHRRQERHSLARCQPEIPFRRILGGRSPDSGGTPPSSPIVMTAMAAVAGMLPLSLALGAGSQMLQPLAIAVIGGILISMVLSLIITPAIQFYLTREN